MLYKNIKTLSVSFLCLFAFILTNVIPVFSMGFGDRLTKCNNKNEAKIECHQKLVSDIINEPLEIHNVGTKKERKQKIIETTCMANVVDSISASESVQFDTLKEIINDGIDVREFSPEVMRALKQAWLSVSSAYSRSNNDFRQILDSLRKFRADYSIWQDLGKI